MAFVRRFFTGVLSFILVSLLFCGCAPSVRQARSRLPVTAPAASVTRPAPLPATADNLGLIDALSILKTQAAGLTAASFTDQSKWSEQRQAILDGINSAIDESSKGSYEAVSSLLANKVSDAIKQSVASDNQTQLIQLVILGQQCVENASRTTLEIKTGKVAGAAGYLDSWVWKGIPYARPPLGDLRWRAPADPASWSGVRQSSDAYDVSTQREQSRTWIPGSAIVGSEDCLYLNVWRPRGDEQDLPVYFWIHGGGNTFGSGKLYDGGILASQSKMVVVTIQYRLGAMGWFNHPALKNGVTLEESSGNFGTLDTIKALQWVRDNIRSFGGNPGNVTVAGESAGGHDTLNLVVSPLAAGLFHRAICESAGMQPATVADGMQQANAVIDQLLVADGKAKSDEEAAQYREKMTDAELAGYLRSKSGADLIKAQVAKKMSKGFHPAYIDGTVIPDAWLKAIASGKYNHVPIIIGSNEYEVKPFEPLLGAAIPTTSGHKWFDLYKVLDGQLKLDDVLTGQIDKELYEACGYYATRAWKVNNVDSIARQLKEKQDNVWAYFFKWGGIGSGPAPYDFIIGPGHATEIPFFFGWPRDTFGYAFTDQNKLGRQALQKVVMGYAAQFAATGDPNKAGGDLPRWETWSNTSGGPKCIVLDGTFSEAKVSMMDQEVTAEGVRAEVEALPLMIKPVVKLWIQ